MAIGHGAVEGRMAGCEVAQEEGAASYKTFDSSSGRSSGRFHAAAGVACVALAFVALVALSSDSPSTTELTVEHARERMTPDANMLDRLLSREEAVDKADEQQLANVKQVAAKPTATAALSAPANLQATHAPLSSAAANPVSASINKAPPLSALSSPPAAPSPPAVHVAAGPSTPLHTAAARVASKQQSLSSSSQTHEQKMGDDGWKDTMVKNDAAAQVSLPGYAYFMGSKAEHNLLKASLASEKHEQAHVVHEDAAFRMDGGMFNDKKTADTPDKQVPLYQNFF